MKTISNFRLRVAQLALMMLVPIAAPYLKADQQPTSDSAAAIAILSPAQGFDVVGNVQFIPTKNGVRIVARITNLTPGKHGFHIHEKGDLSAPDLSSAGPHFNPTNNPHAGPDAKQRHMGDLGNLTADSNGVAMLDYVDQHLSIEGAHSIIGRAVIVHSGPDDLKTQPSGDSGKRVAGGVIKKSDRK